jgi:ADP-ribosyl-[dinitrogen reductase] hydrolase
LNTGRTSQTHPLRIDEVHTGPGGGRIGITFCPGKKGNSTAGPSWNRDLGTDLDVIARWRPDAVVTLIEAHEFLMLGVEDLGEQVRRRGLEWHHLPIVDVQPPDERFETGWRTAGPKLLGYLRDGGRVLVHCRGGLGRAGTVAARLLVELHVPSADAIARVRQARPRAIETRAQEDYVCEVFRTLQQGR